MLSFNKSSRMKVIGISARAIGLGLVAILAACSRKPASIQVSPTKVELYGLERGQRLTARIVDSKGAPFDTVKPTWASSDSAVATVDEGGRVVSKGEGKATITVTVEGLSAQSAVEVVDVATIDVVPARATLIGPPGTSFSISAAVKSSKDTILSLRPTLSSSDEKVVRVSENGVVTSVQTGSATVTARVGELQGASEISVLVRDIARLEVRPATALVRVGDSQRFQVVAYDPSGGRLEDAIARFHTSNPAVATIDASGVAAGVAPGTATIRAEIAGQTAEATLIVN